MANFINLGNAAFTISRNSEYIDKSELIAVINSTIDTERQFSCVTRSRRFGKSMAAKMLCAYYDHSCDSRSLFDDLKIASHPSYLQHLNKYPVIYLDISDFVSRYRDDHIVEKMDEKLRTDILQDYPGQLPEDGDDLMECLTRIVRVTKQKIFSLSMNGTLSFESLRERKMWLTNMSVGFGVCSRVDSRR